MRLVAWFALLAAVALASPKDDALSAFNRKDYATAFRLWDQCAKEGVVSCQYDVGIMYLEGEGRPVDVGKALDWFSRAAGAGYPSAQNKLGILYLQGKVVTRDYPRAMQYFMAAARQGHAAGQANIGLMYWRGDGVPVDLVEAFAWSELSTQKLPSGAKQRDDILKELAPDQWAKGRDRAAALKKEVMPPRFTFPVILEIVSGVLSILGAILILVNYAISKARKKAAA